MIRRWRRAASAWCVCAPVTSTAMASMSVAATRKPQTAGCALRFAVARIARRPARLLRFSRLHRARRHGDRRRRLGRASLADGLARQGQHHSRRRSGVHADPARGDADERTFLARRPTVGRRHAARDGAQRWRRRRRWSSSRPSTGLSAVRQRRDRSARLRLPPRSPRMTASTARPPIRRCWHGSTLSRAHTSPSATRQSRSAPRWRASRTSLPAASDSVRGCWSAGAPCARPGCSARQPRALALPGATAGGQRSDARCAGVDDAAGASTSRRPAGISAPAAMRSPELERNVERFSPVLTWSG